MTNVYYIDPLFKELLEKVPLVTRREANFSYGIAKRIYDILKKKGWSKTDLAKATGKKTPVVTKWMSGTHNFTMRTIAEIEVALGEEIISVKKSRPKSRPIPKPYVMDFLAQREVSEPPLSYGKEPDKE
ncbi:MAG: helix-turn-helix transcriptional regulator [Bacteroidaceae bacterium]|nr:helix-turn-helix transcriptional regulator [Bacteroidaceae bacterium]